MRNKLKLLFFIIFSITMLGGVSFREIRSCAGQVVYAFNDGVIFLQSNSTFTMAGGYIKDSAGENGGAVYVGDGAVFTMNGGTISGCSATKGGAVYVASGGTFNFNGGKIENCTADVGCAIYVESGGTLNYELNEDGFINCGEDAGIHIYAESGSNIIGGVRETTLEVYVDGCLELTLELSDSTYQISEDEMPLDYENCCGYFYDPALTKVIKDDIVELTGGTQRIFTRKAIHNNIFFWNNELSFWDFEEAIYMEEMVFPREVDGETIDTIGINAFCDCPTLYMVLPSTITYISESAFYHSGLKYVNLHDNIEIVENDAFRECENLEFLMLPESVSGLEGMLFEGCSSMSSVYIHSDTISIGECIIADCVIGSDFKIYTDAFSKPHGWDSDFNYCNDLGEYLEVVWGTSYEEYIRMNYPQTIHVYIDGNHEDTLEFDGEIPYIMEANSPLSYYDCCGYYQEKIMFNSVGYGGIVVGEDEIVNVYTKRATVDVSYAGPSESNAWDFERFDVYWRNSNYETAGVVVYPIRSDSGEVMRIQFLPDFDAEYVFCSSHISGFGGRLEGEGQYNLLVIPKNVMNNNYSEYGSSFYGITINNLVMHINSRYDSSIFDGADIGYIFIEDPELESLDMLEFLWATATVYVSAPEDEYLDDLRAHDHWIYGDYSWVQFIVERIGWNNLFTTQRQYDDNLISGTIFEEVSKTLIDYKYNQDIILEEKKETVALLKENEKVA